MPITWYSGPPQEYTTPASAQIDGLLGALNTLISSNSASASATWEVAQYNSTTPRSILLRRKNGSAGRIVIFGNNGSTPNAAAVRGTASASTHYIGYSETSTANTVANYTTGAPLADSDYIPGVACWTVTASNFYTLSYVEFADGIFINIATTAAQWLCGAGQIVEDLNGTAYAAIQGTGTGAVPSGWPVVQSNASAIFPSSPGTDASYSSANSAIVVRYSSANSMLYRIFALSGTSNTFWSRLLDVSTNRHHFFPIWLCWNTTASAAVFGKLRQVAFGPHATRWAERFTVGSPPNPTSAYALGYAYPANVPSPVWFTNFDV